MRYGIWFTLANVILVASCHRLTDRSRPVVSVIPASEGSYLPAPQVVLPMGQTHPFSVRDMLAMGRISDPRVSPDGTRVVFVVRQTDLEANRGRNDLWLVAADGTGLRRLTSHPQSDTNPRWSSDGGTIWFLSDRSGSFQVWRIAVDGGEAEQVTDQPLDVGNLLVSPDGRAIAYTMEVFPDCNSVQGTKDRLDEREKSPATGRVYDRLFVRHWDTWEDGRRLHLFVQPVGSDANAVDVMRGTDADTPSQPFGGPEEIAFTPDGKGIVFTAKDVGRSEPWSTDFDLYLAPVDGSAPPKCLTQDNEAWDTQPAFSPDGRTLAYLAMARPGYEADRFRVMLMDWPKGSKRVLTESWDRSPSSIAWSPDGAMLYAVAADTGHDALFAIDIASGAVRPIIKEGMVHAFDVAGDRVIYALSDMRHPAELYCVPPNGWQRGWELGDAGPRGEGVSPLRVAGILPAIRGQGDPKRDESRLGTQDALDTKEQGQDGLATSLPVPRPSAPTLPPSGLRLTHINGARIAAARMGEYEQFHFAGWNDETVYGYVVKPADFQPGRKYPVAFLIHGGPQGSWNNVFHYRWNPQAFAGAGYAVVMVDFHGSTGYGQAFCDSIRGDWGGKPLVDLQKGLAATLERYPWMDGDRVGALGASFGGYMINWIAGQWPDRFRCLVNHDGSLDERMSYFDTEELWFPEWDHGGTPWDNPAAYEEHNPVRFVANWKTPMLVIHGQQDFRVPATQGLGTFNALQRRGIPSKLLYFPDENHWVLKPHNSILWHDTVIAWLDQWLKQ